MRKLHIGGTQRADGWECFNANPGPMVDHLGNASDLSRFANASFDLIYASHVLEHFGWRDEVAMVLQEWRRVLKPGGALHVSVPDLGVLCRLFLDRQRLPLHRRYVLMQMMFGGQVDAFDFHKIGFDEDILGACLEDAGFSSWSRVSGFEHFADTSQLVFDGVPISLNMVALNGSALVSMASPGAAAIGRNDSCPCGSGQRYKHCHGQDG